MPTVIYDPATLFSVGGTPVSLQAATPGVQEVGNFHVNGTGIVGSLIDDALTSGRVVLAGTAGVLQDNTGLVYAGTGTSLSLTLGTDVTLTRRGTGNINLGAADAAAPVAQTVTVQGARGGTDDNTAAVATTVIGSLGTGTGASGDIVFKVGTPQAAGNTQHVAATALTLHNSGSAGTAAPQLLAADGSETNPAYSFAANTGLGFHHPNGDNIYISQGGGSYFGLFGYGRLQFRSSGKIEFSDAGIGSTSDVIICRRSAAALNLGAADAAAPVAQTLSVQGVVAGTADTAGAQFIIEGSRSTGTGAGGAIAIETTYPSTTGNTQNALSMRSFIASGWTTLTAGAATSIATVTFGASSAVSAEFLVTVEANDGTEYQSLTSRVRVSSVRKAAGNTVSTVGLVGSDLLAESTGTSTLTCTFTVTEGASAVTLKANAASSLTETVLRATFQAVANGPNVAIAQA